MGKIPWLCLLVCFFPIAAAAQSGSTEPFPRGEFFGGYSYFHAGPGGTSSNFNGLDASITENLRPWFGGTLDVSSHWNSGVNVTNIFYGPVFAYRKNKRITPFAHFLAGGVRGGVGYLDISHSESTFGLAAGGGLDATVTRDLAVRVLQVDYVLSRFSSSNQSNVRISAGLVYRFSFGRR